MSTETVDQDEPPVQPTKITRPAITQALTNLGITVPDSFTEVAVHPTNVAVNYYLTTVDPDGNEVIATNDYGTPLSETDYYDVVE